jgi:hypothetical protein
MPGVQHYRPPPFTSSPWPGLEDYEVRGDRPQANTRPASSDHRLPIIEATIFRDAGDQHSRPCLIMQVYPAGFTA